MKINWKDILIRSIKTFLQGFLGSLVITLPNSDIAQDGVIYSLLIGAVSAGLCAVMNFALNLLKGDDNSATG